jgi:hypothetical protein
MLSRTVAAEGMVGIAAGSGCFADFASLAAIDCFAGFAGLVAIDCGQAAMDYTACCLRAIAAALGPATPCDYRRHGCLQWEIGLGDYCSMVADYHADCRNGSDSTLDSTYGCTACCCQHSAIDVGGSRRVGGSRGRAHKGYFHRVLTAAAEDKYRNLSMSDGQSRHTNSTASSVPIP